MAIQLTSHDHQLFRPPLFAQLERYDGILYHSERNLGHPLGIANHSWLAVELALVKVLDCFEAADVEFNLFPGDAIGSKACQLLLETHREFVYRCVEFVETIVDKVPHAFVQQGEKTKLPASIRDLRRHMDLICNKLKHEQNRLVPLITASASGVVAGYCVCAAKGDALQPNRNVHDDRRGFSYATDVRRLLTDIYSIGAKVGSFIETQTSSRKHLGLDSEAQAKRLRTLDRVTSLPSRVFPFERPKHMPKWLMANGSLTIERQGGPITHLQEPLRNFASYAGDSVTRNFAIF